MDASERSTIPARLAAGFAIGTACLTAAALGLATQRAGTALLSGSDARLAWIMLAAAGAMGILAITWLRTRLPVERPLLPELRGGPAAVGAVAGLLFTAAVLVAATPAQWGAGSTGASADCEATTEAVPLDPLEVETDLQQDGLPLVSDTSGQTVFQAPADSMLIRLEGPSDVQYGLEVDDGSWRTVPGNADDGFGVDALGGRDLRLTVTGPPDGDGRLVATTVLPVTFVDDQTCT